MQINIPKQIVSDLLKLALHSFYSILRESY